MLITLIKTKPQKKGIQFICFFSAVFQSLPMGNTSLHHLQTLHNDSRETENWYVRHRKSSEF